MVLAIQPIVAVSCVSCIF
ncbi:MAG: hypothetical protein WKF59_20970 [Chitinophagaceae bacterium]